MSQFDDDLRIIERTDGGPPIEASISIREDGTRILTHVLPSGMVLETIIAPDGNLAVFADGRPQLLVSGLEEITPDDPGSPSPPAS